ncbi:hypothetical protein D1007_37040 [Hordeum vulgare]|nr:hypothetical protein D1007_37040 [Hordeum vulgare]
MGPNALRIILVGIAFAKDDPSPSIDDMYLDCEASLAIHQTISPEVFKSISTCKLAHEVWTKLEDIYGGSNLDEDNIMLKELLHELSTLFYHEEPSIASISDYLHTSTSSTPPTCGVPQDSFIDEQAKSEQLEHELDKAHQTCRDLRSSKGEIEIAHGKLKEDFELLLLECNNVKGEIIKISKIYEDLQSTHEKSLIATYSSHIVDDTCASNPTSFEASTLKENVELCAQLDFLTSNCGKLEESRENLSSTHEDLLISYNELKLALETMAVKVKSCESHVNISTSTINALLSCANPCNSSISHIITNHDELLALSCYSNHEVYTSTSPLVSSVETNHVEEINELKDQVTSLKKDLEKCDDGHSYHYNKKKSKNKKRGQDQATNKSNISCFKCKKVGHHVRSCPLKIRVYKDMLHGKRPQAQSRAQPHVLE